jgi:hypothetical protein
MLKKQEKVNMTDDLVKRLREKSVCSDEGNYWNDPLCLEAADCIENLEAALRWIIEQERQTAHPTVCAIVKTARKALEGKDD